MKAATAEDTLSLLEYRSLWALTVKSDAGILTTPFSLKPELDVRGDGRIRHVFTGSRSS